MDLARVLNRQSLIRFVTFVGGVYFVVQFLLPAEVVEHFAIDRFHQEIIRGFIAMSTMAIGLGLLNLLMSHGRQLVFLRRGAVHSLALLVGLILMFGATVADWRASAGDTARVDTVRMLAAFSKQIAEDAKAGRVDVPPLQVRNEKLTEAAAVTLKEVLQDSVQLNIERMPADDPNRTVVRAYQKETSALLASIGVVVQAVEADKAHAGEGHLQLAEQLTALASVYRKLLGLQFDYSRTHALYNFLYHGLFVALSSAMFALLGFYITSAAYRAFRIRSVESVLMLGAASLVILGQIPFGLWLYDGMPAIRLWLLQVPSAAAFRAITIGASIALLVMAFRMWLGIESESFSEKKR